MHHTNQVDEFHKYLDSQYGKIPSDISVAARYVVDTLELSERAAKALFGDKATPDIVLMVYDRITNHPPKTFEQMNQPTDTQLD